MSRTIILTDELFQFVTDCLDAHDEDFHYRAKTYGEYDLNDIGRFEHSMEGVIKAFKHAPRSA